MKISKEDAEKLMDLLLNTKDPLAERLATKIDDVNGNTAEGEGVEIIVTNEDGYEAT